MTLAEFRVYTQAAAERKAEDVRLAMIIARAAHAEDKAWMQLFKVLSHEQ